MTSYIAIIHKEPDSSYGISFPDFPGCFAAADDLDQAKDTAREALAEHIEWMQEDGEALPTASNLDKVMVDPIFRSGVAFLVEVAAQKEKTVRVQLTVLPSVLAIIDAAAAERKKNRSRFFVEAALETAQANY